jgi:hypothetical protein
MACAAAPIVAQGQRPILVEKGIPSRTRSASIASSRVATSSSAQSVCDGGTSSQRTSVSRPLLERLANSTESSGPSGCHFPTGRVRGSQTSDPQPMHAILGIAQDCTPAPRAPAARAGAEPPDGPCEGADRARPALSLRRPRPLIADASAPAAPSAANEGSRAGRRRARSNSARDPGAAYPAAAAGAARLRYFRFTAGFAGAGSATFSGCAAAWPVAGGTGSHPGSPRRMFAAFRTALA